MLPPPSRNAPCPCGSGKRYKECHGALASPPPAVAAEQSFAAQAQSALGAGRFVEALAWLERALVAEPESAELRRECARVAWMMGNVARATADCRAALDRAPGDATAWNLLGEILRSTDTAAAEAAWRRALTVAPDNAEARFHLGNFYRERGDPRAAQREYEAALASAPEHAGLLNNLGLALEASGERDRAEACYERVLAAYPRHPDALGNLASSLFERAAYRQSAATYDRLFAIRRDVPAPVWVRRGLAQQRMGDLAAAEASFSEAARLAPDDPRIQQNLGTVCFELQRHADAEPAWQRLLELRPENPYALSMLAYGRQHRCDWRGLAELHERINRLLEADGAETEDTINPFNLLTMPTSAAAQLRAAERWARGIAPPSTAARPALAVARGERLRVGFVSSDYRAHPMVYLSIAYWEGIDRDRFETFAYGIRAADPGPIGQRVARAFDHFADVSDASVAAIAGQIRADRIAVLVDLNGYTQHSREHIFALRPAPVQINYLGFPGTLGADWYDYALVDRFSAPDALQPFFTERLLPLPHTSFPSNPGRLPGGPPPTRAECGLPADAFVFTCFNNTFKILPDVFAAWMRLLRAVEGSVLWLIEAGAEAEGNLRREAAAAGIDPARLIFAPRISPVERHVARVAAADLLVDSFPYGAHTTANDALLAGVPLVTHAGETLVSRIAGSQLHAIGLPELVTSERAAYEATARRLAQSPGELSRFRARLAANRASFPLFDTARFTRDVEAALLRAWTEIASP
jgi:predicted O-linked N-acetylglucosamine transferase (SPINDLY family)